MPGHERDAMNIDDEILAKIMKECSSSYIDDAGFAKSVVGKLPRRRMSPATRRLLLVSGAALASTTLAVVLYAPALADLASSALEYVEAGSGAAWYVLLGASSLAAAALGLVTLAFRDR